MSAKVAPACATDIVIAAPARHYVRVITVAGTAARTSGTPVTFLVPDPGRRLAGVRLRPEVPMAAARLDFGRNDDGWELVITAPPVSRMEYQLELRYADGGTEIGPDPANPIQACGPFGIKSVREFPCYSPPGWLTAPAEPGVTTAFDLPVRSLRANIPVLTWAPAGARDEEPLPLLIVHDGPEYDRLASLTRYLSAGITGSWLPRLRAALLGPGQRNRWYSANPGYARALHQTVIPALTELMPSTTRIGMGTSLGALATLHAHCRYPDAFDALFLQSGSFFQPRFDSHERRFGYYKTIAAFVAGVHAGRLPGRPVPVVLTCGALEENVRNNRSMTCVLREHGYDATLHEVADVHNYTAWRDSFDPYLSGLLRRMSP
jgi:enterochelin esterase-like enzyme